MRDILLQAAGLAAIAVALIHGALGETKVLARATIQPTRVRNLIRLVWQAGTVAWIGGGVLLIAAPLMESETARHWIVVTLAVVFASALSRTRSRLAAGTSAGSLSAPWSRWPSQVTKTRSSSHRGVIRQIVPSPSSETSNAPSCATATPTGRPQTSESLTTKPVTKSWYSPVGTPSLRRMRMTL